MRICHALESRHHYNQIPGFVSLAASVRRISPTAKSFSPVFKFSTVRRAPAARSVTAGAPSPSRYFSSIISTNGDSRRHSRCHSRRSHTPRGKPASASTEPYAFPVGRALRYVQLGMRYHGRTEGQADLREWLTEIPFSLSVDAMCHFSGSSGYHVKDQATSVVGREDVYDPELVAEVSTFARYHAHHVLIEYKALRRRIEQSQAPSGGSHRPANSVPSPRQRQGKPRPTGEPSRLSCTPCLPSTTLSPPPLSAHLAAALTQSLFNVSVLLHVSGLFGVAETHVERMLGVCFSTSIFLAQDAATVAASKGGPRQGFPASSSPFGAPLQNGATAAAAEALPQSPHLHSLHWAIVHFAAGVHHWGLMDHQSPLQNVERTQRLYERLLQTHAALLCEQTRRCVDYTLLHELVLLKSGRRAPAARDAWFMGSEAAAYSMLFGTHSVSSSPRSAATHMSSLARCVPPRLQQRRLQLLPLLWLSLLCSHLQKGQTAVAQVVPTCAALCGVSSRVDREKVTWASARHAFAALLPLFSKDARLDVTAWATMHLLFFPQEGHLPNRKGVQEKKTPACDASAVSATANASLTELCALLARIEHAGAMQELGVTLPGPAGMSPKSSGYFHLALFLRRWLDETSTQSSVSSSFRSAISGLGGSNSCVHLGATTRAALRTPQIHTASQLYRALLNIPLSALYLPPATVFFCAGLPPRTAFAECVLTVPSQQQQRERQLSVTAEGVCLLNQLLLRVLLQWRRDQRFQRISTNGNGNRASTLSRPEPTCPAGGVSPNTSQDGSCAHAQIAKGADAGECGDAVEDQKDGGPPAGFTASYRLNQRVVVFSAEDSRLLWEREVVCVLKATQHLGTLMNAGAVDAVLCDQSNFPSVALARALVAPTVQAAVRALAEQLGGSLLPWRLLLLHREHVPLTTTELQLLSTLDATLCHLLLPSPPKGFPASDARATTATRAVGVLPIIYRASINALMCTDA